MEIKLGKMKHDEIRKNGRGHRGSENTDGKRRTATGVIERTGVSDKE